MKNRILPAIGIVLVSAAAIYFGGAFLNVVVLFIIAVSCYEFCAIRTNRFNIMLIIIMILFILAMFSISSRQIGIMIFYIILLFLFAIVTPEITTDDIASCFLMSVIIAFAMQSVIKLSLSNKIIIGYIVIAAFLTDAGAYILGSMFGKHKLIPRISPKKSVEGAIGGYIVGFITSFLFAYAFNFFGQGMSIYLFFSATLPIVSQIGDLSFSMIKRTYGVKDFGSILLGHGGILDRCDSLFFCLIFYVSVMGLIF